MIILILGATKKYIKWMWIGVCLLLRGTAFAQPDTATLLHKFYAQRAHLLFHFYVNFLHDHQNDTKREVDIGVSADGRQACCSIKNFLYPPTLPSPLSLKSGNNLQDK
jgi:hypothetical protein